jgi:hypothetical protein
MWRFAKRHRGKLIVAGVVGAVSAGGLYLVNSFVKLINSDLELQFVVRLDVFVLKFVVRLDVFDLKFFVRLDVFVLKYLSVSIIEQNLIVVAAKCD